MTFKTTTNWMALAAVSTTLAVAGQAVAQAAATSSATPQETPSQARARATTQSLNQAPGETSLSPQTVAPTTRPAPPPLPRPTVRPPTTVTSPTVPPTTTSNLNRTPGAATAVQQAPAARTSSAPPPLPRPAVPQAAAPLARTVAAPPPVQAAPPAARVQAPPPASTGAVAAPPAAAQPPVPEPARLTPGYYVRGDKGCDEVWPGEGDIAWLSPTSFVIDFGGCEPGTIRQTSPTTWHEDQRCMTELGGDAGLYSVNYELTGPDAMTRRARLGLDEYIEEDTWKRCEVADVPEEARFKTPAAP